MQIIKNFDSLVFKFDQVTGYTEDGGNSPKNYITIEMLSTS